MEESLDPRVRRLDLKDKIAPTKENEHWVTYQVFHQKNRGDQPVHVGIVHAPSPQMALVFAKEQFGRRLKTANIWVAKTSDVYTLSHEYEDVFSTIPGKIYREAKGYSVREKIENFKKGQ